MGACDEPMRVDLVVERTFFGVPQALLPTVVLLLAIVGVSERIDWRAVERWLRVGDMIGKGD